MSAPPSLATVYRSGTIPYRSARADRRLGYVMHIPPEMAREGVQPQLIVYVHGSWRNDAFAAVEVLGTFADWHESVVLCPVFPANVLGDGNLDGYKDLMDAEIRYDLALLDMVDEVAADYGWTFPRFALAGFSGGAQFVNRFLLVHPQRLSAASIGSPGLVTRIDNRSDWWVGTRNMLDLFGGTPDIEALRRVPVHLSVGDADTATWQITHAPGSPRWRAGMETLGATRPDRLRDLHDNLSEMGVTCSLNLLAGVAHDERAYWSGLCKFLSRADAAR